MAAITTGDWAYSGLPHKLVSAANGVDYAYRDNGRRARSRWSCSTISAATSTTGILRWSTP